MSGIDTAELSRALLTASLTIFGGIVVLVIGQLVQKFFIEPYHQLSRTIGEVSFALVYYADVYSNPGYASNEEMVEAKKTFRRLAAQLSSDVRTVEAYSLLGFFLAWPKKSEINQATENLIGISNGVFKTTGNPLANDKRRQEIIRCLRLDLIL